MLIQYKEYENERMGGENILQGIASLSLLKK